jgi:ribosomal protein L37E
MIGKVVRCPKCKQGVELKDPKAANRRKPSAAAVPVEAMDPLSANQDLMTGTAAVGQDSYARIRVCPECGKPMNSKKCKACGYVEVSRSGNDIERVKPKMTGMQLWLCKTLAQGLPVKYLALIMHGGIALLMLLSFTGIVMAMTGGSMSVWFGAIVMLGLMVGFGFYFAFVFKGYQFLLQPAAELAWFQRPLWDALLSSCRRQKWSDYDSRLSKRLVITDSNPSFTDADLAGLDGLANAGVLDLEGTQVSDAGLASLYKLKNLQCLVLKNTNVSNEEVYRFQQQFPQVWIWH